MAKPNRECIECSTKFYRSPSDPNPYCSCRCKALHQRGKRCEHCEERFIPDRPATRFCCLECNASFKRKSALEAAPFWFQCSTCLAKIGLGSKKIEGMMRCMLYGAIEAQWRLRGIQAADVPGAQSWKEWRLKTLAAERDSVEMAHRLIMEEYRRDLKGFADWSTIAIEHERKRKYKQSYGAEMRAYLAKKAKQRYWRLKGQPAFDAKRKLRSVVSRMVYNKGMRKLRRATDYLGCTYEQGRAHIERQWMPGMTWVNHGEMWEIDHIVPLSSFDLSNEIDCLKASHYTNLQPLWKDENRAKKASQTWRRAA